MKNKIRWAFMLSGVMKLKLGSFDEALHDEYRCMKGLVEFDKFMAQYDFLAYGIKIKIRTQNQKYLFIYVAAD